MLKIENINTRMTSSLLVETDSPDDDLSDLNNNNNIVRVVVSVERLGQYTE